MLRTVFAPIQARRANGTLSQPAGWLQEQAALLLSSFTQLACLHPIRTLVFIAIMASTTYITLLQSSLFDPLPAQLTPAGEIEFSTLLAGSKMLHASEETSWKWQNGNSGDFLPTDSIALLTFVFPDSAVDGSAALPPQASAIPQMNKSSIRLLPSSKNLLSPFSHETTMAVSLPYHAAPEFVNSVRELPLPPKSRGGHFREDRSSSSREEKRWMMSAAKKDTNGAQKGFKGKAAEAWTAFVDLLKNAEELDIIIMVLGYLSMHLTFVSLFLSLRRLGSNFWLGTTTLFSSIFAFLFGLKVTTYFNVPINMVLLSEGLPFLVVTIGFEKPIIFTKAVLEAAVALKKSSRSGTGLGRFANNKEGYKSPDMQTAIEIGVRDCGYEILRDYAIEILILVAGAASGVQGGLCQFCFLAAWILFFDCILLFTFYTAILTIKLEINRIRRHATLRRVLEEDGVSRQVAEEVASSEDWPRLSTSESKSNAQASKGKDQTFLGFFKARDSSVARFKVLMVSGFIAINLLNFCSIPFRNGTRSTGSALSSVVTQPTMDPFKVAGSGLDTLLALARVGNHETSVTVLTPIKFELEYPSVHYAEPSDDISVFDLGFADQFIEGVGGRVVEGVLKSFEDPFLSKWIILALALSLVLNGYLFNAARWSIKEPTQLFTSTLADGGSAAPTRPRSSASEAAPAPAKAIKDLAAAAAATAAEQSEDGKSELILTATSGTRTRSECEALVKDKQAAVLNDEELIELTLRGKIPGYALERVLGDKSRAVKIRRGFVSRTPATKEYSNSLERSKLPYEGYDYDLVYGACCENVIGYMPLPIGVAGPMIIDGVSYYLPMATTEGVLIASTNRGAKAINGGGGAVTVLTGDGMTRGPCVSFNTMKRAGEAKLWLDSDEGQHVIRTAFNSTSRFARLRSLKTALAGTYLYIRFKTTTGDAMGMNMISKGVEHALKIMATEAGFDDMTVISVSGNYCTDKKPAAINWIDGRGKSVVAEAIIPADVVKSVLKIDVDTLVECNTAKNLIGSAMAGSIGGNNAHAANIVTAMFLATGQDPAQNVESSNCITILKNLHGSLQISVSMPCIEVGTIGGGTFLGPQAAMLDMLGVRGAHPTNPGNNSRQLARIIGAACLAGELSILSALAAGHLVNAHMQHNRSQVTTRANSPTPSNRISAPTTAPTSMTSSNGVATARKA